MAVLLVGVVLMLLVSTTLVVSFSTTRTTTDETQKIQAFYAANTGVERTLARIKRARSSASSTTASGAAALLVAAANTNSSVTLPEGGSYSVSVSAATPGADGLVPLTIVSTGRNTAQNATRRMVYRLKVRLTPPSGNLGLFAPAAITTTGGGVNSGNAPIQGVSGSANLARSFTVTCAPAAGTVDICAGVGSPATYTVTASGVMPSVGQMITYTDSAKRTLQYRVSAVQGNSVTLVAINERLVTAVSSNGNRVTTTVTTSPLKNLTALAPTTGVPAVLTYYQSDGTRTNGSNTDSTCGVYGCYSFDVPPSELFKFIFGVDKTTFKTGLGSAALTTYDRCPGPLDLTVPTVQWLTASGNVSLTNCDTPRVLVVEATGGSFTVSLNNSTFKGLLYVINDGAIRFQGNGTIGGALIAETGTATSNPEVNIAGTAKIGVCGQSGNHDPKACYDREVLDTLVDDLTAQVSLSRPPAVDPEDDAWSEEALP